MRAVRRITTLSDRTLDRAVRLTLVALVLGALGLAGFYYQDRHVSAGPSLLDRQVASAELAVRKAPGNVNARLALAVAYQADSRLDDAIKQYDQILKVNAKHRAALLGKGRVLLEKKQLDKAAAAFESIVKLAKGGEFAAADPQLEEAYFFLGQIALKQHKPSAAMTALKAALKIEPTDSDALYLRGVAALDLGQRQQAVADLTRALQFVPTGWCEPFEKLNQAYTALSQQPKAEYAAGMADLCRKRFDSASRRLSALVNGSEATNAMLGLGLLAEMKGQPSDAISWYRRVLGRDAKNVTALSALSRLGSGPTGSGSHSSSSSRTGVS